MSTLFYFREDFLFFHFWALGGIILCIWALLLIIWFRKKLKNQNQADFATLKSLYNRKILLIFFIILIYLLCGILVLGIIVKQFIFSIIWGIFLIFVCLSTFLLSKH